MKKFLLGTTALVASGLVAGAAFAADPIAVKINGFYDATLVLHDDDAPGTGDSSVKQDVEINVNGSTVLDGGVTAGLEIQFKEPVGGGGLGNEEAFAYLEGGMGRAEIGSTDSAAYKMAYAAPYVTDAHSVDTPIFMHLSRISGRTTARIRMSADANKITYFTPRMTGFQLGVSYTPSNDGAGAAAGGAAGFAGFGAPSLGFADPGIGGGQATAFGVRSDANGGVEDILEIGGSYKGTLSNIDIGISLGYAWGDHESTGLAANGRGFASPISGDPNSTHVGLNLASMGWTLGGAWFQSEDLVLGAGLSGPGLPAGAGPRPGRDERVWNAGVTYETGPWKAGIAYSDSEIDNAPGGVGVFFTGGFDTTLFDIGAQYKLGPGVAIGADLTLAEDEIPAGTGTPIAPQSIESKALALTLMLDF